MVARIGRGMAGYCAIKRRCAKRHERFCRRGTSSRVNYGFYIIMAAQFFSSLADNALLVAAIALLIQAQAPSWLTPYLKFFFVISYVALAPFVGAFADRLPKGQVMLLSYTVKIVGCVTMLWGVDPIIAYAIVGLGAAAYSPAKYGILTEYLPHRQLVVANGWIEGLTVASIILGTMLGGLLIHLRVSGVLLHFDIPLIETSIDTAAEAAIAIIVVVYAIAALFNLEVPRTGVPIKKLPADPVDTLKDFARCVGHLWRDRLGQISLAVTTLFWGAGATLQFIVIEWARVALGFDLSGASILQGVTAFGIAIGAVLASLCVTLDRSVRVIPLGIAMGLIVIAMIAVSKVWIAVVLMIIIGGLAGFFVVPMNALLQHRGHHLVGAGRSIAVQNFNENSSILVMIALYSVLLGVGFSIYTVVIVFGLFVAGTMTVVQLWYLGNRRRHGDEIERLLAFARAEDPHPAPRKAPE
jgi:LPLT family lysophospholipid transporter-like MFS transporter